MQIHIYGHLSLWNSRLPPSSLPSFCSSSPMRIKQSSLHSLFLSSLWIDRRICCSQFHAHLRRTRSGVVVCVCVSSLSLFSSVDLLSFSTLHGTLLSFFHFLSDRFSSSLSRGVYNKHPSNFLSCVSSLFASPLYLSRGLLLLRRRRRGGGGLRELLIGVVLGTAAAARLVVIIRSIRSRRRRGLRRVCLAAALHVCLVFNFFFNSSSPWWRILRLRALLWWTRIRRRASVAPP